MKLINLSLGALAVALMVAPGLAQENAVKTVKGGVLNGKAINLPRPAYPAEARVARVEGTVAVQVLIDEGGNVIAAKAVTPEEKPDTEAAAETVDALAALRAAAEQAALDAKFAPTRLSGNPVKVSGVITYNFKLAPGGKIVNGGVLNGNAITVPNPEYPEAAKAVKASGTVIVQVTVDEYGNVISAEAVSGHPLLQTAAVTAAREAKFAPTSIGGQPTKFSGVITYNFVLPDKP